MTKPKKPTEADKKFVKKVINKWRPRLFLGEWFIDIRYAHEDESNDSGSNIAAECSVNPVYMLAEITIFPCFWLSDKDKRTYMLVHELNHCHTQKVWNIINDFANGTYTTPQKVRDEIETLTQRITNIAYQQEWK